MQLGAETDFATFSLYYLTHRGYEWLEIQGMTFPDGREAIHEGTRGYESTFTTLT